jgi:hypothetical protein
VVEVAAGVDRLGLLARRRPVAEEEELDLGVGVEGEPEIGGLAERALEDEARVGVGGAAVRHEDVAEHAGRAGRLRAPRQDLEGRRVGLGEHVRLVDPGEALDRGAVEADPLGEGPFELGRSHRDGLQEAQDVGEPEPHETDVSLLQGAEHELFLLAHVITLPPTRFRHVTAAP